MGLHILLTHKLENTPKNQISWSKLKIYLSCLSWTIETFDKNQLLIIFLWICDHLCWNEWIEPYLTGNRCKIQIFYESGLKKVLKLDRTESSLLTYELALVYVGDEWIEADLTGNRSRNLKICIWVGKLLKLERPQLDKHSSNLFSTVSDWLCLKQTECWKVKYLILSTDGY